MNEQRWVQILITCGALLLLILKKISNLEIDNGTLVLLGIAAIPWMVPLIKTIKLPGIGEVEFNELKKELDEISVFVFKTVINKDEVAILKKIESDDAYILKNIDGMSNNLYQLRDSELISLESVSELKSKHDFDLKEYATITDHGRSYLKYWRKINEY